MTIYKTAGPPRYLHQRAGLQKMIETGGCAALLFDPGMGKTAVVIDYAGLLALKSISREARVLVVCPLAAVDTWVSQAETFMSPQVNFWAEAIGGSIPERGEALAARGGQPFPRSLQGHRGHPRALHFENSWAWSSRASESRTAPLTLSEGPDGLGTDKPRVVLCVINLDTLTSRQQVPGRRSMLLSDFMVDAIKRFQPDLVVVDESHKIKSATGNASRLLARVAKFVKRRTILTGTVMPHSPLDVFGQWRFLAPYAFGERQADGSMRQATDGTFKARFAVLGGWMGRQVTGFVRLDEMQAIMAQNAIVGRKEDALDLPPTTEVVVPVRLSPAERQAYDDMKQQLATMLASGALATVPNRLTQMLRLRQITSGYLPDDTGRHNVIGTAKADTIASLVNDTLAGEKRVVVFCFFSDEIAILADRLAQKGTEIMRIEGGTAVEDRRLMRKRFGSDDPTRMVMIAQIRTMSLAVNELVTSCHAIFGSLSQQRDDFVQAKDRLDRIGQTRNVTFWLAIAPGTVDEVILSTHRDQGDLESAMLKHIAGGA